MLMVLDPASAQFDSMPNSVIHTGVADYVLAPEAMPGMLLKYVKHPLLALEEQVKAPVSSKDGDILASILDVIRDETGLDFSYYKPSTVIRRIERRMGVNQIEKLEHYHRYLEKTSAEIQILYSELLIGVTRFLRDKEAFDLIAEKVIPEIVETRERGSRTPIRIWVAGCSSGEEVYSLAILLNEYYERQGVHPETKIFATDIDQRAVDIAATGKYPASIVSDMPMPLLSKYFFKSDDSYQVVEKIRKMVIFARHNLLKDPPFHNLDLVTCRNLLIYLQNEMQHKVLSMFGFALKKDRFLFLGSSETVGALGELFAVFDSKWRIYRYKGGASFIDFHSFESERNHETIRTPSVSSPARSVSLREVDTVMQRIQSHLLDLYLAPTLVLDQDLNLIHTIGEVNDFLQLPKGQVSFNIFKLTDSSLSGLISNAVRKARQSQQTVRYKDVVLSRHDSQISLTFVVEPFFDEKSKRRFFLLVFQGAEKIATSAGSIEDLPVGDERELRLQEVEHELQLTRENLQATIEELETSNEELQATNEELMSANEELQSTNEELQSVNEELYTLNSEYQNKIEELTGLNNDMDNLFNSTHIGTLFLDRAFRIRKFTPAVKEQFPVIDQDIGRPITHFAVNFDYPQLMQDLQQTLKSLTPRQRTVCLENGTTYQVRILPYRTSDDTIEGLIMTFVDITEQVKISAAFSENKNLYRTLIESVPHIVWLENAAGRAVYFNKSWYQITGLNEAESLDQGWSMVLHPADRASTIANVDKARKAGKVFSGEARYQTKEGVYRHYQYLGIPVKDDANKIIHWVGIKTDVTAFREAQQSIIDSERLFRRLYEHAPIGLTLKTLDGHLVMVNPALRAMLGYDEKDLKGMSYQDITPSEYHQEDKRHLQALRTNGSFGPFFKEYQTRSGQRIPVVLNGITHTQADGTQYVWSFIQRQQPNPVNCGGEL
jgi:two-component system CheB/CheR fusion protein